MRDTEADSLFRAGRYEDAASHLRKGYEEQGESGRDSLLYLLDLALSLHAAGKYEESTRAFLKADKLAEIKDYTSLAAEAGTLLTSDNIKDYKAEDFENVLINTYLAMNFALEGNHEDAIVEAKRVNQKLHRMVTEGQRKYKQNAFARYLSGVLYEAEGEYGDAYIDYKEALKLEPELPLLKYDLWRMAWLLRERDEMERWDEKFSLTAEDRARAKLAGPKSGKGEIIVLYENGISPVKRPNPSFHSLPKFFARANPILYAEVHVDGTPAGPTVRVHDVESTAIENLEEKYGGLVAKKIGGVVAKEVVGNQIERQSGSPLVGALAKILFYASDQADTRSWNLLPKDFQVARVPVDPGIHAVKLQLVGGGETPERTVAVKSGQKTFVNFRSMP